MRSSGALHRSSVPDLPIRERNRAALRAAEPATLASDHDIKAR